MRSNIEQKIKEKIDSVGVPLKDWNVSINYGIKTGFNDAFIITGNQREQIISEDPKSAEIIRPILRGRDIKRYETFFADLWLITTFPSLNYNINDYPAIKKHLLSFGIERLEQTGITHIVNGEPVKARKRTNNKWYETQDSISYWDDFNKQKIVWGNLCLSAQFALADEGMFISAPSPMIVPGNKYLLAVLNSKLGDWYIRQLGVTRNGGYFEYKPMFVSELPIPILSVSEQEPFVELVNVLLNKTNSKEDVIVAEQNIDQLVYKLYGLSDDEIEYINTQST